jgi:hypothetical protein
VKHLIAIVLSVTLAVSIGCQSSEKKLQQQQPVVQTPAPTLTPVVQVTPVVEPTPVPTVTAYDDPDDYCGLVGMTMNKGDGETSRNEGIVESAQSLDTQGEYTAYFDAMRRTLAAEKAYTALARVAACDKKITLIQRQTETLKYEEEWQNGAIRYNAQRDSFLAATR